MGARSCVSTRPWTRVPRSVVGARDVSIAAASPFALPLSWAGGGSSAGPGRWGAAACWEAAESGSGILRLRNASHDRDTGEDCESESADHECRRREERALARREQRGERGRPRSTLPVVSGVQVPSQPLEGALQARANGLDGLVETGSDLPRRHALEEPKPHHCAIGVGQGLDRGDEAALDVEARRHAVRLRHVASGRKPPRMARAPSLGTMQLESLLAHHAPQPGAEVPHTRRTTVYGSEQRLLGQVLGVFWIPNEMVGETPDAFHVFAKEIRP